MALFSISSAAPMQERERRSFTADYNTALSLVMQYYHEQKSGSAPSGVSWRGDCFMNDDGGRLAGGWHDAGK